MMAGGKELSPAAVWAQYETGKRFNNQINLDDTVENNENFFIGKQWEGVAANGLPTPVFNFLKRVTLFQVASITSDNLKLQAAPLNADKETQRCAEIVNGEFNSLFEHNRIGSLSREFMRNAAVDGDGCMYVYWDAEAETGQKSKGAICTEALENTRVFFGNANDRRVQKQPYIIIERRVMLDEVRSMVDEPERIQPDARQGKFQTGDKVTVLLKLFKENGTVHAFECTKDCVVREKWDLGIRRYPIVWLNWDYVHDCYHGQALITGLIPNQLFVNKAYAAAQLSLMTSAFPKTVYDKTRVPKWTNQVGGAIGVAGGDVNGVAKILEPAQISPQVAQFINQAVDHTQTFLGATAAAMGDTRPDNTSAIIALQRASAVPSEITRQNFYQCLEDLGLIYMDFMAEYYGKRKIFRPAGEALPREVIQFQEMEGEETVAIEFDFAALKNCPMSLKLDVGASSYWSEIAAIQTLDNLLSQGKIDIVDYLERIPDGYVTKRKELMEKYSAAQQQQSGAGDMQQPAQQAGLSALAGKVMEADTAI